jgi:hypothetical protein
LSNEEKTNDYENFEKRGGSREKGGGGNEIHAPCACACVRNIAEVQKLHLFWVFFLGI